MATFTIEFKGIAIVYHRNDFFRVILPFHGCHDVLFKDGVNPDEKFNKGNQEISFEVYPAVPGFAREGRDYNLFMNLTASYAHSEGIQLKDNTWRERGTLVNIQNAVFSSNEKNFSKYQLIGRGAPVDFARLGMGYKGLATIDTTKLIMKVNGKVHNTYENGEALSFNNDCKGSTSDPDSDLKLVYQIIKSKTSATQFSVRRHPNDVVVRPVGGRQGAEIMGIRGGSRLAGPDNSNPKPQIEEGLPCHLVIVSDPNNLP